MQADMQIEQMKAQAMIQIENQKQAHEHQMKINEIATRDQFERYKADLDAQTQITVAQINAGSRLAVAQESPVTYEGGIV